MRIISGILAALLLALSWPQAYGRDLPEGAETDGATFVPKYKNPTPGQMTVMMTAATTLNGKFVLTDEWYADLENLGVNMISGLYDNQKDQAPEVFELAEKHNLKVLYRFVSTRKPDKVMADVCRWRDFRSLGGYMLCDEPDALAFPELRRMRDAVFTMDTTRIVFVNLFPNVPARICKADSYKDYVEKAVRELRTGLLSYDHYPVILRDGKVSVKKDFYENLEIISSQARQADCPFWAFSLVFGHYDYPEPVESDIRFEVFNALAYGAQGIDYWLYNFWNLKDLKPTIAPVDTAGQRTRVWYDVQRVNREIQGLNHVFLGCGVVGKGHVGTVPEGTEALETLPGPLKSIRCGRQGVLVSQIRNEDRNYIVIVNHEPRQSQKVKLRFDGTMDQVFADGRTVRRKSGTFRLAPGGYLIFRY